ncbi:DUF6186 family protein [Rhodoluna limnophila]|jgi:hypothetical protein|uniref:DUF6186 family protein n=1 Tax=Rhodoluna limnophila TaxID=232537 RepID=UPI001106F738|nr:DUF6186 family protein [Rhodoluna limnophila]
MTIPLFEYLLVIVAGIVMWLLGRLRPDLIAPFGGLIARMMHHRNTRLALVVVWWWLGWHFFTE